MDSLYLALSVFFNVIANGFFKSAFTIEEFSQRKIVLLGAGLLIGLANTGCYIKSLETIGLGTAYAIFAASSTILIAVLSVYLFHESVSIQKVAGLAVICAGLLLLWKA